MPCPTGSAVFPPSQRQGCTHTAIKTGSGPKAAKHPRFKWVNTVLGNVKAAMVGTYRAVRDKQSRDTLPNSNTVSTVDTASTP